MSFRSGGTERIGGAGEMLSSCRQEPVNHWSSG